MTPLEVAERYLGVHEQSNGDNPLIQWWLSLCGFPTSVKDEVAWCSAFVNGVCWFLGMDRTRSAAARSWLDVGLPVPLSDARPGYDVVIFSRGAGQQAGPEVVNAPGHVAFYKGRQGDDVVVLGGNQGNQVSVTALPSYRVLGVRRLAA